MSSLIEIQEAVAQLPKNEKKALELWLISQSESEMPHQEEEFLLRSLNEAMHQIDSGKGISITEARKQVSAWAAK